MTDWLCVSEQANLYGKDEENSFGFVQRDIEGFLALDSELMSCHTWGLVLPLAGNCGRGLLNLCIADANKDMLLNCAVSRVE